MHRVHVADNERTGWHKNSFPPHINRVIFMTYKNWKCALLGGRGVEYLSSSQNSSRCLSNFSLWKIGVLRLSVHLWEDCICPSVCVFLCVCKSVCCVWVWVCVCVCVCEHWRCWMKLFLAAVTRCHPVHKPRWNLEFECWDSQRAGLIKALCKDPGVGLA